MQTGMPLPPEVREAIERLGARGHEAYAVGGCVRDFLRGVLPQDYDLTTDATPQEVRAAFPDHTVLPTGERHGTVTLLTCGRPLEITTYRADGAYSDGRRPDEVTFTHSLDEDLARRDFTVNAIAYAPAQGFRDPFGGMADLARGCLRAVGDPERRFTEDALRILRALRFSSTLGYLIGPTTESALRREKTRLPCVSAERIYDELKKLLCGREAGRVLTAYADVLGAVIPELLPTAGFDQHSRWHRYDVLTHTAHVVDGVPPLPRLRLAALFHDIEKPSCFFLDARGGHFHGHEQAGAATADTILTRLRADGETHRRVVALVRHHGLVLTRDDAFLTRCLNRFGPALFRDLLALSLADNSALSELCRDRPAEIRAIMARTEELIAARACFSLSDLAVNGRDLMAAGFPAGPGIGRTLQTLLGAVMDGRLPNERTALLVYAASLPDAPAN